MALFYAIRKDSVSLLRFAYFSHVHIFSCEISLICRIIIIIITLLWELIIIIITLFWELFIPASAEDFSMEFEWQQINSNLQDSSKYSGRSYNCCSLNRFNLSSNFWVFQSLNFWGLFQVHQLQLISPSLSCSVVFTSLAISRYLSLFSLSFNFTLGSTGMAKSTLRQVLFYYYYYYWF